MKIMQVTDVHIGRSSEDTHGVDVKRNLDHVLEEAVRLKPDSVVLTGDLCFKGPHEDIYRYIHQRLSNFGIDPIIIPGNHDSSGMLSEEFDIELCGENEIFFKYEWKGRTVIFLDTGKGEMSNVQYEWFENTLRGASSPLIFMHHPPAICGVPYMDINHSFKQIGRFQKLVRSVGKDVEIFCGHYHVDKVIELSHMRIHITPSTFFQIRDDIEEFGVDSYRIGYRLLGLENGTLSNKVVYLNGSSQ